MRSWKFLLPLLASTLCFAAQPDRITGTIDSGQMVVLPGRIHRMALPQYDQGPLDGSYQFTYVTMLFTPSWRADRSVGFTSCPTAGSRSRPITTSG